jgi:hypothetical protein
VKAVPPYSCVPLIDNACAFHLSDRTKYEHRATVDGKCTTLILCDPDARTRASGYGNYEYFNAARVILLCFDVMDALSFQNVETIWRPEIEREAPGVPHILVGLKIDLREDEVYRRDLNRDTNVTEKLRVEQVSHITVEDGNELARRIGSSAYVECSSLAMLGVSQVFEEAVRSIEAEHLFFEAPQAVYHPEGFFSYGGAQVPFSFHLFN